MNVMDNGMGDLATETVVTPEEEKKNEEVIVEEKDLIEPELPDPLNKPEDDKTLNETLYENSIKDEIEENKKELKEQTDEFDLPDPTPAEKSEAIDNIVEEMKNETDDWIVNSDTLEKIATMFYEKEEDYTKQIKQKDIKIEKQEAFIAELQEELNNSKYDKNRITIDDEDVGYFVSLRKKFTKNPWDKQVQKDLVKYHMLGIKEMYPEFDIVETSKSISEKRLKAIEAVTAKSTSDAGIKTPEPEKKRPVGWAIQR